MRRLATLVCVGLAGAAVAMLPSVGSAQSQPTTASFVAVDNGTFFGVPSWNANGTTTSAATIAPGGTVYFSYPSGTSTYNAVFDGAQPSACTQTAATAPDKVGPAPPLPQTSERPGWSGYCRFDTTGTYTFHDGYRGPAMSGTITVAGPTAPPPTSSQTTTTAPPTTTTFHEPTIPAAASSLRAASAQRGTAVHGQINVTAPGSRLIANLYAGSVRVGRTTRHGVGDGTQPFTVSLSATGRKAFRVHHRLSLKLSVQVLLAGALGPTTLSRHVTLSG